MKRLKQHWTAGPLACLLSAALTLTALLAWLVAAPRPADAQTLNRLPTWAVVTFQNHTGYGGGEVGTEASDGFVVELGKSNKYDVLPRAQTEQTIADLGLIQPLDKIGLQKLARSMEADAVATGEVASVSFQNSPRRATVTLIIRVVDRVSGELINGAVAKGTSTPRPVATGDDDSLVNDAIGKADFEAVRQISAFNLARATVLIHPDPAHVTLNEGSQEGLYPGLSMLVTRNGTEVGRIQVTTVEPDEANALVTDEGLGINTDDIATAIYQLPAISSGPGGDIDVAPTNHRVDSATTGSSSAHSFFSGPLGAIFAGALGVAFVALAAGHGGGGGGSSPSAIGGGQASVGQAALTFNGLSGTIAPIENPVDMATFLPAAIQINFGPGNIQASGPYFEYHVYRDPEPDVLENPNNFSPPTQVSASFAPLPIFGQANSPEFDTIEDVPPILLHLPDPTNNTNTPIAGDFYAAPPQSPIPGTGLMVGDRVRYRIQILYSVPNLNTTNPTPGSGLNTGTGPYIYSLSIPVYSNYVTYLQPPLLSETIASYQVTTTIGTTTTTTTVSGYPHPASVTAPDNDVFQASTGPNNIVVTFRSVYINPNSAGAGLKYALDFSTDPNFSPSSTLRYTQIHPPQGGLEINPRGVGSGATVQFGASGNPNSTAIDLTSSAATAKLGSSPAIIYVRVGVRDTRDPDDSTFIYSTLDPNHYTDPNTQAYILPASLTPGGGNHDGSVRPKVVTPAQMSTAQSGKPGAFSHLTQRTPSRPAFTPSVAVHPNTGDQHPIAPPAPMQRTTAPVRPSTPGH